MAIKEAVNFSYEAIRRYFLIKSSEEPTLLTHTCCHHESTITNLREFWSLLSSPELAFRYNKHLTTARLYVNILILRS